MHQLARSTWKRTASQLQEEQALKPDRTVDQRLTNEGVTLVPPAEDTEQVKVLRLRRDQIDPTHLLPDTIYRVKRNRNGDLQLLLQVQARAADGDLYPLRVLVDTGAQANLVRRGVLPERLFAPAERPLSLSTACGQAMEGGQREVQLHIGLKKENMNDEEGGIWWGEGLFHDADITVDAIVGWPWLKPNGIVIVTTHNCLATMRGSRELRFLWPWVQTADEDSDEEEDQAIDTRPVFAAGRPPRTTRIGHHALKGTAYLDRVASLRAARGTSTYLRQKKREEQVLDPLQVSEEESSGSEFPELEEDTSSDGEREETPARRQRPQGPVVWQCYVQPGEVVDFRLANGVPVVRSCGVANQGPAPRSERQSARPGHKWQQLRRVEGASRRMRERRAAREREEQRTA